EAFLFQNAGEVLGGLELLETELAETEDAIDHDLRLFPHGVDLAGEIGLHRGFFIGGDFWLGERGTRARESEPGDGSHRCYCGSGGTGHRALWPVRCGGVGLHGWPRVDRRQKTIELAGEPVLRQKCNLSPS